MPEFVCPAGHRDRLDRTVAAFVPDVSRTRARRLIDAGSVFVDGHRCRVASRDVRDGVRVRVELLADDHTPAVELAILFADHHMIAIDKPPRMPSAPTRLAATGTALEVLRTQLRRGTAERDPLFVVHRLDAATSGVLLFARSQVAAAALGDLFQRGAVDKEYVAIVAGPVATERGSIAAPLIASAGRAAVAPSGRAATTDWQVRATTPQGVALSVTPRTGRMHQIRVHLAHIGMPIVGDVAYGGPAAARLFLHAHCLRFRHPFAPETVTIESPLPAAMDAPAGSES